MVILFPAVKVSSSFAFVGHLANYMHSVDVFEHENRVLPPPPTSSLSMFPGVIIAQVWRAERFQLVFGRFCGGSSLNPFHREKKKYSIGLVSVLGVVRVLSK